MPEPAAGTPLRTKGTGEGRCSQQVLRLAGLDGLRVPQSQLEKTVTYQEENPNGYTA